MYIRNLLPRWYRPLGIVLMMLLFLFFSYPGNAQTNIFMELIKEGDIQYKANNYIKAFELFIKAKEKAVNSAQSTTAEARAEQSRKAIIQQQADLQTALATADTALRNANEMQRNVEKAAIDLAVRKIFPQWIGFDKYQKEFYRFDTVYICDSDEYDSDKPLIIKVKKDRSKLSDDLRVQDSLLWALDSITLSEFSLIRLPIEVRYCPNLKSINLFQCPNFSWNASEPTFSEMNVKNINAGVYAPYNDFEDIKPPYRRFMKGTVVTNGISRISEILVQQTQLESLSLSGFFQMNKLSDFEMIFSLNNLRHLDLQNNELDSIPPAIGNLKQLTYLNLAHNNLNSIPSEMEKLRKLENLYLGHNQLTVIPSVIDSLVNLKVFSVESNKIAAFPPELLNLSQLDTLNFSRNRVKDVPHDFSGLKNLKALNLSDNILKEMPKGVENLTTLNSLDLSENLIEDFPADLHALQKLENLNLSSNRLSKIPSGIFSLPNLKQLNICNINTGDQKVYDRFEVFLSEDNTIDTMYFSTTYYSVNPDSGFIMLLPPEIGNLSELKYLNISGLKLTSLPVELGRLSKLSFLDISYNHIAGFPACISKLYELRKIKVWDYTWKSSIKYFDVPDDIFNINLEGRFFYDMGQQLMDTANYRQAFKAFEKALEHGYPRKAAALGGAAACACIMGFTKETTFYYNELMTALASNEYACVRNIQSRDENYMISKELDFIDALNFIEKAGCDSIAYNLQDRMPFQMEAPGRSEEIEKYLELIREYLLRGKADTAIFLSRHILENYHGQYTSYVYLALGNILKNEWLKSEEIIIGWKGRFFPENGIFSNDLFLQTLNSLEKAGINHPDFQKVRDMLNN